MTSMAADGEEDESTAEGAEDAERNGRRQFVRSRPLCVLGALCGSSLPIFPSAAIGVIGG